MNKSLSIYLDLIRFVAAIAVFFAHAPSFIGGYLWQLASFGHQAVVIFFLLSGFVIAYVVEEKEKKLSTYIINRASRIYSVAIPAIIIAWFVYMMGMEVRPEVFYNFNISYFYSNWTFLSALSFTNQAWVGISIFSNPPYWSLSYEILFYVFFAIIHYLTGLKKLFFSALLLLLMGPSILLYLPIWLLGVYCYRNLTLFSSLKTWQTSLVFLFSLIGISILCLKNTAYLINSFAPVILGDNLFSMLLHPAQYFLVDYLIAICVACNILSYTYIVEGIKNYINLYEKTIRFLAGYTFSAYLYHFPILCLYSIFFPFKEFPIASIFLTLVATPLTIWLLGHYTEKHKKPYRVTLIKLFKVKD